MISGKMLNVFHANKMYRLMRTFINIVLNNFPSIYSHLINQVTPRGEYILA